jgi:hypothetical protein
LDVPTILSITQERALTTEGITLSTPSTYSFKTHPLVAVAAAAAVIIVAVMAIIRNTRLLLPLLFCAAVAGDNAY